MQDTYTLEADVLFCEDIMRFANLETTSVCICAKGSGVRGSDRLRAVGLTHAEAESMRDFILCNDLALSAVMVYDADTGRNIYPKDTAVNPSAVHKSADEVQA